MNSEERAEAVETIKMMREVMREIVANIQDNAGDYLDERTNALAVQAAGTYNELLKSQMLLERKTPSDAPRPRPKKTAGVEGSRPH